MNGKILNITNGDVFNQYFISNCGIEAIPFREAMMDGETVIDIFSDEFIKLRASVNNVSVEEYKSNMLVYNYLQNNDYDELCLWFGKDTFCQMNLLTLLAFLEQINYTGKIALNYIDDETFEKLESTIPVELGIYRNLYENIIVSKHFSKEVGVLDLHAIELYFDYHSENGALSKIVRDNSNREKMDILIILLENSKEYGLSDIQAKKLIERNKKL